MTFGRRSFLTGSLLASAALIEGSSLLGAAVIPPAANTGPHERALRDARLVWQRLPTSWQDAALLGNGSLTAQVHFTGQANAICFAIGTAGVRLPRAAGAGHPDNRRAREGAEVLPYLNVIVRR